MVLTITDDYFVMSQCTRSTDGRTGGRTDRKATAIVARIELDAC